MVNFNGEDQLKLSKFQKKRMPAERRASASPKVASTRPAVTAATDVSSRATYLSYCFSIFGRRAFWGASFFFFSLPLLFFSDVEYHVSNFS